MVILSKACKPDNFESDNSLKLSFTNISGIYSNFIDCESFLECNSSDILALCETNLDDSIDSGNFSVRGYLPLIWKDSSTYMHDLAVYVKEGPSFCTGLMSQKFCRFLIMFSTGFSSLSVWLLFPLSITFFVFVHGFLFYSSNIDDVLSIKPSTYAFVFGDFNIHHKDWLTYSDGANRPVELCYNISISNDLTQMVNFPTRIPDCDSHSPAFLDLFLSWR